MSEIEEDIIKVLELQVEDLQSQIVSQRALIAGLQKDSDDKSGRIMDLRTMRDQVGAELNAVRVVSGWTLNSGPLPDHIAKLLNTSAAEATQKALDEQFEAGRAFGRKQMSTTGDDVAATLQATIDGLNAALQAERVTAAEEFKAEYKLNNLKREIGRHLKAAQEAVAR